MVFKYHNTYKYKYRYLQFQLLHERRGDGVLMDNIKVAGSREVVKSFGRISLLGSEERQPVLRGKLKLGDSMV